MDIEYDTPPAGPETFEILREKIRDRFEELSPHLRRIARMALDKPNEFALQTIAKIASELNVQPSTLIRFAKEFDYVGFSGLQQVFRLRLIEGAPVYRERVFEEKSTSAGHSDAADILDDCIGSLIASLESVRRNVDPNNLAGAIEHCLRARHIYVAGLRRSRPIATYLAYGMTRLERQCSILDFGGGMAVQQVANMGHQDLLVGIAFAPYTQVVLDVIRDAHVRGLPIIAITDSRTSPLAHNSTISFFVDNDVTGQFRPISGAIGIVQSLIVGLSGRL